MRYFKEFNDEKWEQVRTHPYYADFRESTLAMAERFAVTPPPTRLFSEVHLYVTTGNREIYERTYEDYFARLNTFFAAYMLTGEDKYLTHLADIIWCICDMESWSIPAHVSESLSIAERRNNLDLCSTIAGFRLSEVLYFLGDKLPELVVRRARAEIRYRVIDSYAEAPEKRYWWPRARSNWSAVCIASVLCTYMYAAERSELDSQLDRMMESAEAYLDGFADDGCCTEGYGYWNYGFSFFCVFASMLAEYTDGKINYFEREKVKRIAKFQESITLNEHQCVSFSDSGMDFRPYSWLSHFLKGVYPELRIPAIPQIRTGGVPMRYILWQNPDMSESSLNASEPTSFTFDDAQWFIYRCESYAFACKAGHNDEQHNHNDVGSFIVSKGGAITFADPGVGEYTEQYFSPRRYELMLCSSRGHSVPIINGKYQVTGGKIRELTAKSDTTYGFEMKEVYDEPTLTSANRTFTMEKNGVLLQDSFKFTEAPTSLTERFVSLLPITVEGNRAYCGNSVLVFDGEELIPTTGSEQVARKQGKTGTVYYLDLAVKAPREDMTFTFTVE